MEAAAGGGGVPVYDLKATQAVAGSVLQEPHEHGERHAGNRRLVETAMLAAVGGLVYTLSTLLKLQAYFGYLLPLPVVVAAMRNGPAAGRRTMSATAFLLLVLLGPVQAATYLLNHGLLAGALGGLLAGRAPWALGVPAAAAVRVAGQLGFIALSGWTMNENLWALLLTNVFSLLDQMAALVGAAGAPPRAFVVVTIAVMLVTNALVYCALTYVLYAVFLRALGYSVANVPAWVERRVFRQYTAAPG